MGGRAGAGGGAKSKKKSKNLGTSTATLEKTNISVTHAGKSIHWELNPAVVDANNDEGFLNGEVFRSRKTGRLVDACRINWQADKQKGPLVIAASVYTRMD